MASLRKSAAEWTAENPILFSTQLGQETDTLKVKRGNDVDPWNSLQYDNTITVDSSGRVIATPLMRSAVTSMVSTMASTETQIFTSDVVPSTPSGAPYPGTSLYPSTTLYPNT